MDEFDLDCAFRNGYLAGLTAYARSLGHSTLKSENGLLCDLIENLPSRQPDQGSTPQPPAPQPQGASG